MKIFKTHSLSVPSAIILSSIIISISIFLTVLVFFGGTGNRQKFFIESPTPQRPTPPNMTPEQIKKIQEQRAAQMNKIATSSTELEN